MRAIYEDREGVLWVGTREGGLGRLSQNRRERETGTFLFTLPRPESAG